MHRFQLFWLIVLFCPIVAEAQFVFQNLKEEDGLSAKDVRCLYKDADGFLWIGTGNGLNRFDGHVIKGYQDVNSVSTVEVNGIHPIDGKANLLVATSRGLKLFNKSTGKYRADNRWKALTSRPILSVKEDDQHRLWFICQKDIFIYDGKKVWKLAELLPWAERVAHADLSFAARSAFCWDAKRKGFWVGGYGCYFIDCANETVYDSAHNPHQWPILNQERVTAITLDNEYNLWYGSAVDFSLHFSKPDLQSDTAYLHLDKVRSTDGVNCMFVDDQDRLWISTWMYAAYVKEPGKPIRKIPYSQDDGYSIAYGHFNAVLEDEEKDLWFATINGLSKLTYNNPFETVYRLPSEPYFLQVNFASINALAVRGDSILAMKDDGLVLAKQNERVFSHYIASKERVIKNRFFGCAFANDTWWFGGNGGLYFLRKGDKDIRKFSHPRIKPPLTASDIVVADNQGRIWFQIRTNAFYRYNPKTNECERFDGTESRYGRFNFKSCQSALTLRNGDVLFAIRGEGILRFSERTQRFTVIPVLDKDRFYAVQLMEETDGNLWMADHGRGLYKLNHKGQYIDSLTPRNGLLTTPINSIARDKRGAIWVAGPGGLSFFFPKTKKVTRVSINLGKTLQDYWNYVLATPDHIYAAMLDHIVVIDPTKFTKIVVSKPPHITSVKVFGNEISDFLPTSLTLPASKDFVTLQYASLKHRDIPSLQYSYQLADIDKKWVYAGRNITASYNSLKPGDYVFKVRSTDEHARWMKKVAILKIRILPHWWESWWFQIIVGCMSGIFFFMTYISYVNRKHKRELGKTIEYFVNSVYGENSVDEICWDIARNCCLQLRFEDCTVFLWDHEKEKLVQKAMYGSKNSTESEIVDPLQLSLGEGIVGSAAKMKKVVNISDTSRDHRYIAMDANKLSEIAVPILHEGKLIGVLDSEHSEKRFFTEDHTRALVTIASINANKIAEAQAEAEAAKKELMLLEINRMLAESQLMALRAQMNPHFVFNCLNSIQECIVTQKYGEASKYLNKFSRLFRMVLNNSDRTLVTIEEEKEVLQLYLELEQMRFEQSFISSIEIDEDLEADDILLPSMLLQPYVENAIWHGLMHKEGYRELKIVFSKIDEDVFKCIIEDNGIGREKSLEIKRRNAVTKRHKSKGLQIAKDRLDLIDRQGQHASVNIIDKYDDDGNATGTMVVIELSTSLDYT